MVGKENIKKEEGRKTWKEAAIEKKKENNENYIHAG